MPAGPYTPSRVILRSSGTAQPISKFLVFFGKQRSRAIRWYIRDIKIPKSPLPPPGALTRNHIHSAQNASNPRLDNGAKLTPSRDLKVQGSQTRIQLAVSIFVQMRTNRTALLHQIYKVASSNPSPLLAGRRSECVQMQAIPMRC